MSETTMTSPAGDNASTDEQPQPVYSSAEEFVTERFLPMFPRPLGGEFRWCASWWMHAEAITRLTALWHSWEKYRLIPGDGIAEWLQKYLGPELRDPEGLMGARGPFYQCSEDEHIEPRHARAEPAPPGWWNPDDKPGDEANDPPDNSADDEGGEAP